jgi:hypothetical protein
VDFFKEMELELRQESHERNGYNVLARRKARMRKDTAMRIGPRKESGVSAQKKMEDTKKRGTS